MKQSNIFKPTLKFSQKTSVILSVHTHRTNRAVRTAPKAPHNTGCSVWDALLRMHLTGCTTSDVLHFSSASDGLH